MKKYVICILAILLVSTLAIAGMNPGTGIKSTSHDLSKASGRGNTYGVDDGTLDRICIYCHAPHHTIKPEDAAPALTYYPLWNHDLSTIATYQMYQNASSILEWPNSIQHQLNATLTQPGSVSKLCLSCHDGSVAVSSYGNFNGGISTSKRTGTTKITINPKFGIGVGGDLRNHHPIGFDYGAVQLADDEIRDPSTVLYGNNPAGLTINDLLFGGKMECASCHDVHNTKNSGSKFTWVQDTGSNLCFSCHAK